MSTILLVEPNPLLGRTYAQALEHAGYTVRLVQDAQTAILAADECTPDLVVLELQLPVHGGVEFLYEFRSYGEWLQIPVVLHTYTLPQRLEPLQPLLTKTLGICACLYKPQTPLRELVRAVRQAPSVLV